jgi:hypothetical protein
LAACPLCITPKEVVLGLLLTLTPPLYTEVDGSGKVKRHRRFSDIKIELENDSDYRNTLLYEPFGTLTPIRQFPNSLNTFFFSFPLPVNGKESPTPLSPSQNM